MDSAFLAVLKTLEPLIIKPVVVDQLMDTLRVMLLSVHNALKNAQHAAVSPFVLPATAAFSSDKVTFALRLALKDFMLMRPLTVAKVVPTIAIPAQTALIVSLVIV